MDFDLTEDQKEIKRVAHELLQTRSPFSSVRAAAESGRYAGSASCSPPRCSGSASARSR